MSGAMGCRGWGYRACVAIASVLWAAWGACGGGEAGPPGGGAAAERGAGPDEHGHAGEGAHGAGEPDEHGHGGEGAHGRDPDVPAGEAHEVRLGAEALARAGIATAPVALRTLAGGGRVPAEVRLIPERTAHVAPLVPGRIVRVEVTPGQRVEAGQLLAVVASAEVAALAARLEEVEAQRGAARQAVARQRPLVAEGISAERVLVEAEAAARQLAAEAAGIERQLALLGATEGSGEVPLYAPIAGVIVEMHATLGERTGDDEPPFVIADPGEVWVVGWVPELRVAEVAVGTRARLALPAYPGERWEAPIRYVAPALDAAARALPVRLVLPNPDGRLRAGLFGTLELLAGTADEAPRAAIPREAVVTLEGRDAVFVARGGPGVFAPVFVTLGRREGGEVEVVAGLEAGEEVVVSGAFTLKSALQAGELAEHEH